jgi:CubicO group peptidase (beta-lactamase class C family)
MRIVLFLLLILLSGFSFGQVEIYFPPAQDQWETQSPEELGWCTDSISALLNFLDKNDTRAFLLLKDGRIVLEEYFHNFEQDSFWYWASAGKTLTAFLTGLSQEYGFLDIQDPTSEYLGNWTIVPEEKEDLITIWHQLTMTTGLNDGTNNLDCTDPTCLEYLADAGTRWSYHNAPYTLISQVIEESTHQNYNSFTRNELMNKIGGSGLWVQLEYNRVFFSSARTMARFGTLILANGEWDGVHIMEDKEYFRSMITPSQDINESYGYLWWLNGQDRIMVPGLQNVFNQSLCPPAPDDMVAAMGKNSQLLNVVPSEGLVMVRMGESPSELPVSFDLQNGIWEYLNDIICLPSNQEEDMKTSSSIYPNPVIDVIRLEVEPNVISGRVEVYNLQGQLIFRQSYNSIQPNVTLPIEMNAGVYLISLVDQDGIHLFQEKFQKI